MKQHFLGLAAAILTFTVGWSIPTLISKLPGNTIGLPPIATPSEVPSAWTILLAKQNHDLRQIDGPEKVQLQLAIEALRPTKNQFAHPKLFSQVSTYMGVKRYVLVEDAPLIMIPGDSRLQISIFDADGKLLDSSEFRAGWRIMTTEIRFIKVKDIGEVLEVESLPAIGGADVRKQFYAVVGDKVRLIRLEDSNGALQSNHYHPIGFTEVGRSAADWERSLTTKDETEVLATLTWLGGPHLKVNEVRARPAVKKAVNAMKDHPNAWIREAARVAAEQMD